MVLQHQKKQNQNQNYKTTTATANYFNHQRNTLLLTSRESEKARRKEYSLTFVIFSFCSSFSVNLKPICADKQKSQARLSQLLLPDFSLEFGWKQQQQQKWWHLITGERWIELEQEVNSKFNKNKNNFSPLSCHWPGPQNNKHANEKDIFSLCKDVQWKRITTFHQLYCPSLTIFKIFCQ